MRDNLNRNVRTKEIITKFLSLGMKGVNVYNLLTDLVDAGSIKRTGHGLIALPNYEDPQL